MCYTTWVTSGALSTLPVRRFASRRWSHLATLSVPAFTESWETRRGPIKIQTMETDTKRSNDCGRCGTWKSRFSSSHLGCSKAGQPQGRPRGDGMERIEEAKAAL